MPIALAVCVEEMKNQGDVPTTQAGVDRQSHVKYARDYGEECYRDHLIQKKQEDTRMEAELTHQVARDNAIVIPTQKPMKSVCEMHRKCNTCLVSYKVKEGMTHKCGHGQCAIV